jgi:hypothetical protein
MTETTIGHFLSRLVGAEISYGKKKLTHSNLREILRELGYEDSILNSDCFKYDIDEKDILRVTDQNRKIGYYKNLYSIKKEEHEVDKLRSLSMDEISSRIKATETALKALYSMTITGLENLKELYVVLKEKEELEKLVSSYQKQNKRKN